MSRIKIIKVKRCSVNIATGESTERELTGKELERWLKENGYNADNTVGDDSNGESSGDSYKPE